MATESVNPPSQGFVRPVGLLSVEGVKVMCDYDFTFWFFGAFV